ncbi:MAG: hypothetical protein U9R19_06215, partial [Bacteroidota bacterium]|nr:hypothetical protein [Bacteroidota bacterium]
MRKAIVFLSILAGFLSGSLFAQTPEIEWGAKFDIDRDYQYDRIVGQDDEKIFIIKKEKTKELGKSNIWLESISKLTMGIESSYKLEMPKIHSKKSNFENLYFIDGKLILFVTVHDQMKKISSLYMMHIDEDGITKGEPQMLTFMALIVDHEAGFKFSLTSDKKFVIVHYHIMFSTYTGEPLYFKMINSDLNV